MGVSWNSARTTSLESKANQIDREIWPRTTQSMVKRLRRSTKSMEKTKGNDLYLFIPWISELIIR